MANQFEESEYYEKKRLLGSLISRLEGKKSYTHQLCTSPTCGMLPEQCLTVRAYNSAINDCIAELKKEVEK